MKNFPIRIIPVWLVGVKLKNSSHSWILRLQRLPYLTPPYWWLAYNRFVSWR